MMNNDFCCPVCGIQTDLFVPDRRNDHFVSCQCYNNCCTIHQFIACRLCKSKNSGTGNNWYHTHLKRIPHNRHVRNLQSSSFTDDNNELIITDTDYDNNTVQSNYDTTTSIINDGNNDDAKFSNNVNDVLNFDIDFNKDIVQSSNDNSASFRNKYDNDESVDTNNKFTINKYNNDDTLSLNENNEALITSNNCNNYKTVIDSCPSIDECINYIKDTSKEVNKEMIYQLGLLEPTYQEHRDYFYACIENKGPNYVVHKFLTQSDHQYFKRNNSNTIHALLQTKLCMRLTIEERTYYASILKHILENQGQQQTESHRQNSSNYLNLSSISVNLNCNDNNIKVPLYVPTSALDIRVNLMEGKNSILQNLPTPIPIHHKSSGYIYIPIKETIIFMCASENPPVPFLPFDN